MDTMQKKDIIQTILSLPPLDRIEIVDKIMEVFNSCEHNDIEILWAEESERRLDAYLNGFISAIPANEVFNKINDLK